jgi:hypothetical protein
MAIDGGLGFQILETPLRFSGQSPKIKMFLGGFEYFRP